MRGASSTGTDEELVSLVLGLGFELGLNLWSELALGQLFAIASWLALGAQVLPPAPQPGLLMMRASSRAFMASVYVFMIQEVRSENGRCEAGFGWSSNLDVVVNPPSCRESPLLWLGLLVRFSKLCVESVDPMILITDDSIAPEDPEVLV